MMATKGRKEGLFHIPEEHILGRNTQELKAFRSALVTKTDKAE